MAVKPIPDEYGAQPLHRRRGAELPPQAARTRLGVRRGAGHTKDPITAQGISNAFRDAELCASPLGSRVVPSRRRRRAHLTPRDLSRTSTQADGNGTRLGALAPTPVLKACPAFSLPSGL